ncbi:S-layer homology domain-containing protein [Anaerocolumna sp. AGMB13020]|uniref:S-layer homology domain-containing protein n=1 Tax=Anaerocolumna sp. AGMB13020 TaxID=3081750 RepID=UPI002953CEA5|nr:S-layer homology domain-containing protein [Anaerocolumna sp. AGMB13020]WOO35095.1 S-layer homology domain-containing protein [Anaerocolumna sp. AGMB13020]
MTTKILKNKGISLLLVLIIIFSCIIAPVQPATAAASNKIKIYNFIKLLVPAVGLEADTTANSPYLKAALAAGIVKEGDFKDYKADLTRVDAAVLLNRADEYLNGDKVDPELLAVILEKRISDIKKIPAGKREAVGKVYAKGLIVGKSNGMYIQNRAFNGYDYLTTADAKKVVSLLTNTKGRAKLSPDGQLIRTTNLPKNAKSYPYILEAFPNSFYEMKYQYQLATYTWKPVEGKDYASSAKITTAMDSLEIDKTGMCIYVDDWMKKVENNLKYRLNVDYRTINSTWVNNLRSTYFVYKNESSNKKTTDDIKEYMNYVKKNQIVIKSSVISVEPSSLYFDQSYRVRAYVKFKISFPGEKKVQEDLFFARQTIYLPGLSRDKWFEGIYDIELATGNGSSNGSDFAIFDDSLNDYYYKGE